MRRALLTAILVASLGGILWYQFVDDVEPSRGPSLYVDLLQESSRKPASASDEQQKPEHGTCQQLTHVVVSADSTDMIERAFTVPAGAELHVSGCLVGVPQTGRIRLTFPSAAGDSGAPALEDFQVTARQWWNKTFDLSRHAAERGSLRIGIRPTSDSPGTRLLINELYLEYPAPSVPDTSEYPRILLVSADALRADGLGAFGGEARTPNLDRFVAEAQVFERHYAASHWTKPSHASLLTGLPPAVHGVTEPSDSLRPGVVTLAERFRRAGFSTGALVNKTDYLHPRFGFDRGFQDYRLSRRSTPSMARSVVNWLAAHRDEPSFYFLHTYEVHSDYVLLPYEAPGTTQDDLRQRFDVNDYGCRDGRCASKLLSAINDHDVEPLPLEGEVLRYLYDRGVEALDHQLGVLLDQLRAHGLYDDMTIVLTSDHGEEFLEHGKVLHESHFEEVLRVPLLIKWPEGRSAGRRHSGPSSALDVAPTLASFYDIDAGDLPGYDLTRRPRRAAVYGGSAWHYIIQGDLKLVAGPGVADPGVLYDLARDPNETADLGDELPARRDALAQKLRDHQDRDARLARSLGTAQDSSLTAEERSRLDALGYAD